MKNPHPLTRWRKRQKPPMGQQELADQLQVTLATVSRWEARRRFPWPPEYWDIIYDVTGITIGQLAADRRKSRLAA